MSCVKTETVNAPNLVPEVPPQSNPQRLRLHAPVSQSQSNRVNSVLKTPGIDNEQNCGDFESRKGLFGYITLPQGSVLPYILRRGVKYASVKMAEREVLNQYLTDLPSYVGTCYTIVSSYVYESECRLLNDINIKHNDCFYGNEAFSPKDLIVKLDDVIELVNFLKLCRKKLVINLSESDDRCGFLRINSDSVVPYIFIKGLKQVPLFYFEDATGSLNLNLTTCSNWDLAYLKFCCKVQGIRNELFSGESFKVTALEEVKQYFPSGTLFEDYWPLKGSLSVSTASPKIPLSGSWVQKPPDSALPGEMIIQASAGDVRVVGSNPVISCILAQNFLRVPPNGLDYNILRSGMQGPVRPSTVPVMQQPKLPQSLNPSIQFQYQAMQARGALASRTRHQSLLQQQILKQQQLQKQTSIQLQNQQTNQYQNLAPIYRLIPVREFPYDKTLPEPPYKPYPYQIENTFVTCYNVMPHQKEELFVPLPELVKQLFQKSVSIRELHAILTEFKILQYRGNSDQTASLRKDPNYVGMGLVPLVLVTEIVANLPALRQVIISRSGHPVQGSSLQSDPAPKRPRLV